MYKLALLSLVAVLCGNEARAQVGYVSYYQPVTVYRPAPVYAVPAPLVYSSFYAGPPVVSAPVVVAPAPVVQPITRVRTRYRPILGGTVTRVTPGYRTYYPPASLVYGY